MKTKPLVLPYDLNQCAKRHLETTDKMESCTIIPHTPNSNSLT